MRNRTKFGFLIGLLIILPSLSYSQQTYLTPEQIVSHPVSSKAELIFYGKESLNFGELRIPEGTQGPHPLVILLHGGCWLSMGDLTLMNPLADRLLKLGIATWNIEYRPVDKPGGAWPGMFFDVASGIDYVRELEKKYSLKTDRMIIIGHSAGGHLALWAGIRPKLPPSSPLYRPNPLKITGVLSLAGITDMELAVQRVESVCGIDAVGLMLGGTRQEHPDRYTLTSPIEMLPSGVNEVLVFASQDPVVYPEYGFQYFATAASKKQSVGLVVVPDASHYELIAPWTNAWPLVETALTSLLNP